MFKVGLFIAKSRKQARKHECMRELEASFPATKFFHTPLRLPMWHGTKGWFADCSGNLPATKFFLAVLVVSLALRRIHMLFLNEEDYYDWLEETSFPNDTWEEERRMAHQFAKQERLQEEAEEEERFQAQQRDPWRAVCRAWGPWEPVCQEEHPIPF